jgi:polyvinyl alcohol dehydrogenase (cytochrome)
VLWQAPADNVCKERTSCDPGILASIAAIPGAVIAGHMDGRIRAYESTTGKVLWQYDAAHELIALGGAAAHGGSIGGGGPVVHDGMVYANSGYGLYLHMAGNVFVAFSVNGK